MQQLHKLTKFKYQNKQIKNRSIPNSHKIKTPQINKPHLKYKIYKQKNHCKQIYPNHNHNHKSQTRTLTFIYYKNITMYTQRRRVQSTCNFLCFKDCDDYSDRNGGLTQGQDRPDKISLKKAIESQYQNGNNYNQQNKPYTNTNAHTSTQGSGYLSQPNHQNQIPPIPLTNLGPRIHRTISHKNFNNNNNNFNHNNSNNEKWHCDSNRSHQSQKSQQISRSNPTNLSQYNPNLNLNNYEQQNVPEQRQRIRSDRYGVSGGNNNASREWRRERELEQNQSDVRDGRERDVRVRESDLFKKKIKIQNQIQEVNKQMSKLTIEFGEKINQLKKIKYQLKQLNQ